MLAEGKEVAAGRFAGDGTDGTYTRREETHEGRLVLHALAVVEGTDDAQLTIVGQQTAGMTHQIGIGQRRGVTSHSTLAVRGLQRIHKEGRITDDGVIETLVLL